MSNLSVFTSKGNFIFQFDFKIDLFLFCKQAAIKNSATEKTFQFWAEMSNPFASGANSIPLGSGEASNPVKSGFKSTEIKTGCKKCGYPGHLTFQCRNFVKLDPVKDVVLDVSSTSSDSEDEYLTPLTSLRAAELKAKKKKAKKRKKSSSDSDSEQERKKKKRKKDKKKKSKKEKKKKRRRSSSSDS